MRQQCLYQSDFENTIDNDISFALGNQRYSKISERNGDTQVDLRQWETHKPTKKGI